MNPFEPFRTVMMLLRLRKSKNEKQVSYYQHCLPDGTLADIYRNVKKERSLWILVHGMVSAGPRHQKLVQLAKTLARGGITCVVPKLNGLAACRWDSGDLEQLENTVTFVSGELNREPGLMGFCNGGSYSLIIAGREKLANKICRVITIGAYYDLEDLINRYRENLEDHRPKSDMQWEDEIYRYMALLYGYGDRNLLPATAWEEMLFTLERYSVNTSANRKKQFYEKYLRHLDLVSLFKNVSARRHFDALSPVRKLANISVPVTVVHSTIDWVVPPVHAEYIYSELQKTSGPPMHQRVVTSALSHVTPGRLGINEIKRLYRVFALLSQSPGVRKEKNEGQYQTLPGKRRY